MEAGLVGGGEEAVVDHSGLAIRLAHLRGVILRHDLPQTPRDGRDAARRNQVPGKGRARQDAFIGLAGGRIEDLSAQDVVARRILAQALGGEIAAHIAAPPLRQWHRHPGTAETGVDLVVLFVGHEKEGGVGSRIEVRNRRRAAQREGVVIAPVALPGARIGIVQEAVSIHPLIAQLAHPAAVPSGSAGLHHKIEDAAAGAPELGRIAAGLHAELLQRLLGDAGFAEVPGEIGGDGSTIQQHLLGEGRRAVDVARPVIALHTGSEFVGEGLGAASAGEREGEIGDCPVLEQRAGTGSLRVQRFGSGGDDDGFDQLPGLQFCIRARRASHIHQHRIDDQPAKSAGFEAERVSAGGEVGKIVLAGAARHRMPGHLRGRIGGRDTRPANHTARGIRDRAGDFAAVGLADQRHGENQSERGQAARIAETALRHGTCPRRRRHRPPELLPIDRPVRARRPSPQAARYTRTPRSRARE